MSEFAETATEKAEHRKDERNIKSDDDSYISQSVFFAHLA